MLSKFLDPKKNPSLNPVDYFNLFGSFTDIFKDVKNCYPISDTEVGSMDPKNLDSADTRKPAFVLTLSVGALGCPDYVTIVKGNAFDLPTGVISKFHLLVAVRFKGDWPSAMSYVSYNIMKLEIPYIRVGVNYFKVISKQDRYGGTHSLMKVWSKEELKQDHGADLLKRLNKFDDFDIIPNNKEFIPTRNGCYNLYNRFPHEEYNGDVLSSDIPYTMGLISHIFGEQWQLGLKYLKVLYEHPTQILPILTLVSTERGTGKTTFLNWMQMIFGENSVLISPQDLARDFNSGYAAKNIIMIDETVIEKATSIEKLKSIATAKYISVNPKNISPYSIPFFGKVIICTNKEEDFMRIDEEEIRFWVHKIKPVANLNTKIEDDLFNEIPKFLKFLTQLEEIDFSRSRMVFTKEEIGTKQLQQIKEESKSTVQKELEVYIKDFFANSVCKSFEASAIDIKERWWPHNNQISFTYIGKILKKNMKYDTSSNHRYSPFNDISRSKTGTPFIFANEDFVEYQKEMQLPF